MDNSEVRVEQAASIQPQTLKLGLDVHAETIVVVRLLDHSAPQPAQKFTPAKFLAWVKTQLPAGQVHSCYEAGPFGYGLHRDLLALGVRNLVVQPVCLDAQHKGVNHDKSDAKELALRLDRYVAGNTHALATVRVPTPWCLNTSKCFTTGSGSTARWATSHLWTTKPKRSKTTRVSLLQPVRQTVRQTETTSKGETRCWSGVPGVIQPFQGLLLFGTRTQGFALGWRMTAPFRPQTCVETCG